MYICVSTIRFEGMIIEFLVSLCMEYGGFLQGGYPKPPEIITLGPFDLVLESHGDLRIQIFENAPVWREYV